MLIEVVGKDSYKRESTLRVLEQAIPQTYLKKNRISVRIVEDSARMEKKAFLYPGLVIDGKLFCEGRIPTPDEVKKWVERTTGKRIG
jgi:hypothetical protein